MKVSPFIKLITSFFMFFIGGILASILVNAIYWSKHDYNRNDFSGLWNLILVPLNFTIGGVLGVLFLLGIFKILASNMRSS